MIETAEIDALMESTAVVVREYVTAEIRKMTTQMEDLEKRILEDLRQRIQAIPAGPKGEQGDSIVGLQGPEGIPGRDGESIVGPKGDDGRPGKDVDPEEIRKAVLAAVAELPAPKDGKDGDDADLDVIHDLIAAEVDRAVAALPRPKDGEPGIAGKDAEPIHPDTISLMVVREVEKQVAAIPKPKDGRDGLQIDILPAIDPSKSYPRGTFACNCGGVKMAIRNTTPGEAIVESEWMVVMDGFDFTKEIPSEDPREVTIRLQKTSGAAIVIRRYFPVPIYENIWAEGSDYRRGSMVTRDGSVWHCNTDHTKAIPGPNSPDWTLCVKRGQNGKDAKGEKGDSGKDGKDGKDFRPLGSKW